LFILIKKKHDSENIIIILFDAMSAKNLSLYGYPRSTTPNLIQFAEKATVFNQHYSGGNFTTAGTASMLTGTYPWTHRAFNQGGLIRRENLANNPFTLLGNEYYRFAYSQNIWADRLVSQFYEDVERMLPPTAFNLRGDFLLLDKLGKDRALASVALEEFMFSTLTNRIGSSLFGYLYKSLVYRGAVYEKSAHMQYPKGVPEAQSLPNPYLNENVYQGVRNTLMELMNRNKAFFAYFHLFSPHSPYRPRQDFMKLFRDDYVPVPKPVHPLGMSMTESGLNDRRRDYDQLIAQIDFEFGNLISSLEEHGMLDTSYILVTSDHGELFERGYVGHGSALMYEPNIKIPLLIHAPGQNFRRDVHCLTSNVDILPTILSIAGRELPAGLEGRTLPYEGEIVDLDRSVYSVFAQQNRVYTPFQKASFAMRRGNHKLISYVGYEDYDGKFELYDLADDPQELNDLSSKDISTLNSMKEEFLDHLSQANKQYSQ
jgi:arylsulfatase A-like enzyme